MHVKTERLYVVYAAYLVDEIVAYKSVTFKTKGSKIFQNMLH